MPKMVISGALNGCSAPESGHQAGLIQRVTMTSDVTQLIGSLRDDHRNMALLLDLLDAEIDPNAESRAPDYDVVRDIMLYMTEYPDAVHHPKEDIIYQHIKALRPEIQTDLKRVEIDHQFIEKFGHELKQDIEAISTGAIPHRSKITDRLRHYMEQLREHMYFEEISLFSLADELQHYGDWSKVALINNEIVDPLFGSQVERKYQRLLARIQHRIV